MFVVKLETSAQISHFTNSAKKKKKEYLSAAVSFWGMDTKIWSLLLLHPLRRLGSPPCVSIYLCAETLGGMGQQRSTLQPHYNCSVLGYMLQSKIYGWVTNVHMANRNAKYVIFMLLYSISTHFSNNLTARKLMFHRFDCVTGVMAEWEFACLLLLTGLYQQQHIAIYCFVFITTATSSYIHCQVICWWLKSNCFSVKHEKIARHSLPRKGWHVRVLFCPNTLTLSPKTPRRDTSTYFRGWNNLKTKDFMDFFLISTIVRFIPTNILFLFRLHLSCEHPHSQRQVDFEVYRHLLVLITAANINLLPQKKHNIKKSNLYSSIFSHHQINEWKSEYF